MCICGCCADSRSVRPRIRAAIHDQKTPNTFPPGCKLHVEVHWLCFPVENFPRKCDSCGTSGRPSGVLTPGPRRNRTDLKQFQRAVLISSTPFQRKGLCVLQSMQSHGCVRGCTACVRCTVSWLWRQRQPYNSGASPDKVQINPDKHVLIHYSVCRKSWWVGWWISCLLILLLASPCFKSMLVFNFLPGQSNFGH